MLQFKKQNKKTKGIKVKEEISLKAIYETPVNSVKTNENIEKKLNIILEHLEGQSKFILPDSITPSQRTDAELRLLAYNSYLSLKVIFSEFLIIGYDGLQTNGGSLNVQNVSTYIQHIRNSRADRILLDMLTELIVDLFVYTEPVGEEILFRQNLQFSEEVSNYINTYVERMEEYGDDSHPQEFQARYLLPPEELKELDIQTQYSVRREYLFWQFFKLITHCFNESECLLVGTIFHNIMRARYNLYKLETLWKTPLLKTATDFRGQLYKLQEKLSATNGNLEEAITLFAQEQETENAQKQKNPRLSLATIAAYYQQNYDGESYKQRFNAFQYGFFKLHQLDAEKMFGLSN